MLTTRGSGESSRQGVQNLLLKVAIITVTIIIQTVILAFDSNIFTVINVGGGSGVCVCVTGYTLGKASLQVDQEPASPGMFSMCLLPGFRICYHESTSASCT